MIFDDINMEEKEVLTDYLGVTELTKVQELFSRMTSVAAIIVDERGVPITKQSNFSPVCAGFCRATPEGRKRCENCDRAGIYTAYEQRKPVHYNCHANLIDFAAPIMLNGKVIGGILGGQVLSEAPDLEKMRKTAREIGVDEEGFIRAVKEIPVISEDTIERYASYIYEYAQLLSAIVYKTYEAKKQNELAMKAATAKTDFLANMSHEIRTPMNAIIGMAQIALREEMSQDARTSINQVINSANMLLTIINDILDYSRLDAGKMALVPVEYKPTALVQDIVSIISNRVWAKNLEFVVDMDPTIPMVLLGDDIRIKQIIVNLVNNAIKFTNSGQVMLTLKKKNLSSKIISLWVSVKDTGVGIKKEDMSKLFNSFEQVDSKRNRKIEGSGLGLAIANNLVNEMGGSIYVDSVYGCGSTFSFEIPQRIVSDMQCVKPLVDCPNVLGVIENPFVKKQMNKDMTALGVHYMRVPEEQLYNFLAQGEMDYVITEEELVTERMLEAIHQDESAKRTKLIVLSKMGSKKYKGDEKIIIVRKPVSIISLSYVLQNMSMDAERTETKEEELNFEAPDAKVLIVDDSEVNLTVAAGLLEPVNMQVDTVDNGVSANDMAGRKKYDIIFMDHMMPEVDGIEATKMIRSNYPEYADVPIIALTANAIAGSREMYLEAGLNDYIAKPIKFTALIDMLKKWLPEDKIKSVDHSRQQIASTSTTEKIAGITFLDTTFAISLIKSEVLFWRVLEDFYKMIDTKYNRIKECEEQEETGTYVIEVHALKSSSKQIGALSLSKKAEYLEMAGKRNDFETVHALTDDMLDEYRKLQTLLKPYFDSDGEDSSESDGTKEAFAEEVDAEKLKQTIQDMLAALDELDMDKAEEILMNGGQYRVEDKERIEKLKEAIWNMDFDESQSLLENWMQTL